jgi:cytoskeletal protein CcmA (bactofilin family)
MFRKKDSEPIPAGSDGNFEAGAEESQPVPKPSLEPSASKLELPGRNSVSASPKAPPVTTTSSSSQAESAADRQANKRLIVGEGIRLSGEISSCNRLIVEGEVEVTLNDTLALEITSSGRFTGGCEVEEADISGIYEGDLTVRDRLFVRGTGRITGTIRYGQLELERGGQIAGNISVLGMENGATGDASKPRSSSTGGPPLFGGAKTGSAANG